MIDYRAIVEDLVNKNLNVSLPALQVESIARQMPSFDIEILEHSIKEMKGVVKTGIPDNFGHRLFRAYYRRCAAISRIFPILHIFETAYRAFVCRMMSDVYGTNEWWKEFQSHIENNGTTFRRDLPTSVNGKKLSADMEDALLRLARQLAESLDFKRALQQAEAAGGVLTDHDVMRFSTLKNTQDLITSDWHVSKLYFVGDEIVTLANFKEKFDLIRHERNAISHHRQTSINKKMIDHACVLLSMIGVHLPTVYDSVVFQVGSMPNLGNSTAHHKLAGLDEFDLKFSTNDKIDIARTVSASCEGEAMLRILLAEKAARVESVTKLELTARRPIPG